MGSIASDPRMAPSRSTRTASNAPTPYRKPNASASGVNGQRGDEEFVTPGRTEMKDEAGWIVEWMNRERYLRNQLQEFYRDTVRFWRLYLAQRDDTRSEDEAWRANVFVPYPFSGVDTKASALLDILNIEPYEDVDAIQDKDEDSARKVDRLIDYTINMNRWRSRGKDQLTETLVQGLSFIKVVHVERTSQVTLKVTKEQKDNWLAAMEQAVTPASGIPHAPDPRKSPQEYEAWRQMVNTADRPGVPKIPPYPKGGKQTVTSYKGPWFERCNLYGFRFDPMVDNIQEQPSFMRRLVKPESWVQEQVDAGVFDADAVNAAMSGLGDRRMEVWEKEISDMLGVHQQKERDPYFNRAHEVFEVYEPGDKEHPYKVVLNRIRVVNVDKGWPYEDGQIPYVAFRNIRIPGYLLGMSELKQPEELYAEMNKLRSLRLDLATMKTLGVLVKEKDAALPELRRVIKPGSVFDEGRQGSIRFLEGPQIDPALFREIFEIKNDIDESNSTPSQLRGNQATVGRVSATESQTRYNSSLLRIKQAAISLEEDFTPALIMALMRWVEFGGDPITISPKPGQPLTADNQSPFDQVEVGRDEILRQIEADWKFRGATRTLDRNMQLQQLFQYANVFGQNLTPEEMRNLMKRVWNIMGLRGQEQIITDKGTQIAQQRWEQQLQQQAAPGQPPPGGASGAPAQPPPGSQDAPPAGSEAAAAIAASQNGQPVDVSADLMNQVGQGSSLQAPGVVS